MLVVSAGKELPINRILEIEVEGPVLHQLEDFKIDIRDQILMGCTGIVLSIVQIDEKPLSKCTLKRGMESTNETNLKTALSALGKVADF